MDHGVDQRELHDADLRAAVDLDGHVQRAGVSGEIGGRQTQQRREGAALLRIVDGNGFWQERRFSPSADASRLTMEIRVSGGALTAPLTAVHLYARRQEQVPALR